VANFIFSSWLVLQAVDDALNRIEPDALTGFQALGGVLHIRDCGQPVLAGNCGGMGQDSANLNDDAGG